MSEQLSEKKADEPPGEDDDDDEESPYKQMLKNGPPLELHFDDGEKPPGFDDDLDKKSQNTMLDKIKDILPSQLFGAAAPQETFLGSLLQTPKR